MSDDTPCDVDGVCLWLWDYAHCGLHNNINGMVDGDLIWESCISDDQQDFNHTRCEYGVNIVGSMCDTIDHKALLVTTEPCCYFGVWRGIQCVWTTLWSRRHLAGSHFLPESPVTDKCAQGSLLQFDWPQNLALSNLFSLSFFSFFF